MHGPPLSLSEIVSLLSRKVARLEALGVPHTAAIAVVADDSGVRPGRVRHLLARHSNVPASIEEVIS